MFFSPFVHIVLYFKGTVICKWHCVLNKLKDSKSRGTDFKLEYYNKCFLIYLKVQKQNTGSDGPSTEQQYWPQHEVQRAKCSLETSTIEMQKIIGLTGATTSIIRWDISDPDWLKRIDLTVYSSSITMICWW